MSEDMQHQTEWGEDGTSPDPTSVLIHYVVTFLAAAFLAGGGCTVRMARCAAFETLMSYRAASLADLLTIAQVIAFRSAALRTVTLSLVEDVPIDVILRLNESANALSRSEHRALGLLRRNKQAGPRRPQAEAADSVPGPAEADTAVEPATAPLPPPAAPETAPPAPPAPAAPAARPATAAPAARQAATAGRQGSRLAEAVLKAMEAVPRAADALPAEWQSQKLKARALASAAIGAMTGAYEDWPGKSPGLAPPAGMPPEAPRR